MRTILILVFTAFALAGCGGSSNSPSTVTVTAPASSAPAAKTLTPAELAKAFIIYDNVRTKPLPRLMGCDRLAIFDTPTKVYEHAWAVVAQTDVCGPTMQIARDQYHASHIGANVWIQWTDGASVEARTAAQAFTLAAFLVSSDPSIGYGPGSD